MVRRTKPRDDFDGNAEAERRVAEALKTGATELDLNNLKLTSLPESLGSLTNLTVLSVSYNQLTSLPESLGSLTNLTVLDVSYNQLTSLPEWLGSLTNLTELDVYNNQLTSLPESLGSLTNLTVLYVSNNPLDEGYKVAAEEGVEFLLNYLRRLKEGQTLHEVKMLFVGEGNIGKTTLLHALLGREAVDKRPSTEGMEIWREPIPLPHLDGKQTLQCNAWDFGGQKTYRVQHQFFFSKNAVYLLLWDPRSGHQKCDVEGWLERIQLRVGDEARVLIVSTYASDKTHTPHIPEGALREKFPNLIFGFYAVDGMEWQRDLEMGVLLNDLKRAIVEAAAKSPEKRLPSAWARVREEVNTLKESQTCIPYRQFVALCQQQGLTDLDTTTLAAIMNEVGDFVYFANARLDSAALADEAACAESENIVVLQPEWLAKAIGFVVEDKHAIKKTDGVLEHSEFNRIWHGYPAAQRPYFLWLMEEFFISYRLTPDKKSLVPQLITDSRPDLLYWEPGAPAPAGELELNLICAMRQHPPPGIVPQTVVACHPYRYKTNDDLDTNWQNGAFFNRGDIGKALMELKDRELWFTVRAGHPDYFMEALRKTLDKRIKDVWPGLDYDFVVPCPTRTGRGFCKGRFKLEALKIALADGDTTFRCQECDAKQPIEPLLKGLDYSSHSELVRLLRELGEKQDVILAGQDTARSLALDIFRRTLVAIGTDSKEAPCMFTLFPFDAPGRMQKFQLTLWCEHPDEPHSCCPIGSGGEGDYTFERPKEWYAKVSPYLVATTKLLKVLLPIVAKGMEVVFPPEVLKGAKPGFDFGEKLSDVVPAGDTRKSEAYSSGTYRLEGEALRYIHDVLRELEPKKGRKWAGLFRHETRSGEYVWLCERHSQEYAPGLPVL